MSTSEQVAERCPALPRRGDRQVRRTGVCSIHSRATWSVPCQGSDLQVDLLVVDEAHYVKNPDARRTHAVKSWIDEAQRTLFLTGTPIENRVEEFRTLVSHLQPSLARRLRAMDGLAGANAFRSAVAPAYLRRNQVDVLEELPPLVEAEQWVDFKADDHAAYREAVASGNFMAMRQAAYAPYSPSGSAKLERLVELVEEASTAGRKVVVFSFFRGVLDRVATTLDGPATGPLTGSVPPRQRQRLVDDFSSRRGPVVPVSQIRGGRHSPLTSLANSGTKMRIWLRICRRSGSGAR